MSDRQLEIEHRLTKVEESVAVIPKMSEQLDEVLSKLNKYEGRWGAVTLIGAALWSAFALMKDNIIAWLKGS